MKMKGLIVWSFLLSLTSLSAQTYQLSKPLVKVADGGFFKKKAKVTLDFRLEGADLHYTFDGTEPDRDSKKYHKALGVKCSGILRVKAFKEGFLPSETVSTHLIKVGEKIAAIKISPEPSPSYPGNGGATLIDQKAGSLDFRDGNWLGYNEGPITIIIDIGEQKTLNQMTLSTLSSPGSWIMPPQQIRTFLSADGQDFKQLQILNIPVPDNGTNSGKVYYDLKAGDEAGRYVKLIIEPLKTLPEWHPGKGNPAWMFLDEIIVR